MFLLQKDICNEWYYDDSPIIRACKDLLLRHGMASTLTLSAVNAGLGSCMYVWLCWFSSCTCVQRFAFASCGQSHTASVSKNHRHLKVELLCSWGSFTWKLLHTRLQISYLAHVGCCVNTIRYNTFQFSTPGRFDCSWHTLVPNKRFNRPALPWNLPPSFLPCLLP